MSYSPHNSTIYTAAFAGALAAMSIGGRQPLHTDETDFDQASMVAGAFAQEFDTQYEPSTTTALDVLTIENACYGFWSERYPNLATIAAPTDPLTWSLPCSALIAALDSAQAYYASQGITPPPFGGGGTPPADQEGELLVSQSHTTSAWQVPYGDIKMASDGFMSVEAIGQDGGLGDPFVPVYLPLLIDSTETQFIGFGAIDDLSVYPNFGDIRVELIANTAQSIISGLDSDSYSLLEYDGHGGIWLGGYPSGVTSNALANAFIRGTTSANLYIDTTHNLAFTATELKVTGGIKYKTYNNASPAFDTDNSATVWNFKINGNTLSALTGGAFSIYTGAGIQTLGATNGTFIIGASTQPNITGTSSYIAFNVANVAVAQVGASQFIYKAGMRRSVRRVAVSTNIAISDDIVSVGASGKILSFPLSPSIGDSYTGVLELSGIGNSIAFYSGPSNTIIYNGTVANTITLTTASTVGNVYTGVWNGSYWVLASGY